MADKPKPRFLGLFTPNAIMKTEGPLPDGSHFTITTRGAKSMDLKDFAIAARDKGCTIYLTKKYEQPKGVIKHRTLQTKLIGDEAYQTIMDELSDTATK